MIFGDFEQHLNFSALKNRIVDYNIECLTSKCEGTERRGMIMDFGVWVHGTPTLYGVILPADTTLNTCGIVLVSMTIPDLGGL